MERTRRGARQEAHGYTAGVRLRRPRRLILCGLVTLAAGVLMPATGVTQPAQAPSSPSGETAASPARVAQEDLMRVVRELSSPPYEGRRTGSVGALAARAYIQAAFTAIGLEPAAESGFVQSFRADGTLDAGNVIGRVRGSDAAAGAILISAHYDHLGVLRGKMYPGADDNASGVAALLAIARDVKAHPLRHDAIFVTFDAEELGLKGAEAFVARPPVPLARIAIDVNLDMVSRSDRHEIFAAGTSHAPWLQPIIADVQRRTSVRIRLGHDRPAADAGLEDWTMQSDHGVFHKAGVPFLYFGVEDHPDYHQPSDTADRIDPVFYHQVVEMVLDTVRAIDRR